MPCQQRATWCRVHPLSPPPPSPHPPPQALHKIEETWGSLALTFSPYQCAGEAAAAAPAGGEAPPPQMVQMAVDDAIMEALESDNLALQGMSGGKYVQVRACARAPGLWVGDGGGGNRLGEGRPR